MDIFGSQLKKLIQKQERGLTFVPPHKEDGAIEIDTTATGLGWAAQSEYVLDIDQIPDDEIELLLTYRNMALNQYVDEAIQEIVNEAIITEDLKATVDLVLDDVDVSDNIKDRIQEEFEGVLRLLNFKNDGYGLFRRWYIDGKLYFHKVIDKNNTTKGIVQLVAIDPLHIRPVREIKRKEQLADIDLYDLSDVEEYFIYSRTPFDKSNKNYYDKSMAIKIPKEAITYVTSGVASSDGKFVLSELYKAIKPFNNLKMMEDSVVIYRVARAPERRIFYVDTGSLPTGRAEQYLKDVMNKFKNKITYNIQKGTIENRHKFQSILEDYWLPRREGGRGTEVSTLPGGDNLGELDDVEYFKTRLYKALNVPISRFQNDGVAFNIGRTTEITRDEIRFSKFISRKRNKFSELFDDLLKTQLILKKIITPEEWEEIKPDISYSFLEDNYFQELKSLEVLQDRLTVLENIQRADIIGKYVSHDYVRREILRQSEDEMKDEDEKIAEESKNEQYNPPQEEENSGGGFGKRF